MPHTDRERIFTLTSSMVASEEPEQTTAEAWRAKNEVLFSFAAMAEDRETEPRDDIVSLLVDATSGRHGITDDEIIFKNGEISIDRAVDEVLRWTSPSMHLARTALEDVVVGDRTIRAGDSTTV